MCSGVIGMCSTPTQKWEHWLILSYSEDGYRNATINDHNELNIYRKKYIIFELSADHVLSPDFINSLSNEQIGLQLY